MKETIESRVASTINAEDVNIKIGKDTYQFARPTIRTMIELGKLISNLPKVEVVSGREINSIMNIAKDLKPVGTIFATFIVGYEVNTFMSLIKKIRIKILASKILNRYTCSELNNALMRMLSSLELTDFFALTTSLGTINILKKTEVG